MSGCFAREYDRIVGTVLVLVRDRATAEDCVQDAFLAAVRTWRADGVPRNPGAWLTTAARRRAVDRLRHRQVADQGVRALAARLADPLPPQPVRDLRLRLMFTCCHPALPVASQVVLTLRHVAGLTTAEAARALLVAAPAMAQRLVRVKKIPGLRYETPGPDELPRRLPAVLAVVYLLFNEGWTAAAGDRLDRPDLCAEAIRLARLLAAELPGEPEAAGLLALLLFAASRQDARVDAAGDLVTLDVQDRGRWDRERIGAANDLLAGALARGRPGPYQIQAAIAACHAQAAAPAATDWAQIVGLYDELLRVAPSPVAELNRAVALGMASTPEHGLSVVDRLLTAGRLDGYHLAHAVRGDLLERLGRRAAAATAYRRAWELAGNDAERRHLAGRLARVAG